MQAATSTGAGPRSKGDGSGLFGPASARQGEAEDEEMEEGQLPDEAGKDAMHWGPSSPEGGTKSAGNFGTPTVGASTSAGGDVATAGGDGGSGAPGMPVAVVDAVLVSEVALSQPGDPPTLRVMTEEEALAHLAGRGLTRLTVRLTEGGGGSGLGNDVALHGGRMT